MVEDPFPFRNRVFFCSLCDNARLRITPSHSFEAPVESESLMMARRCAAKESRRALQSDHFHSDMFICALQRRGAAATTQERASFAMPIKRLKNRNKGVAVRCQAYMYVAWRKQTLSPNVCLGWNPRPGPNDTRASCLFPE